MKDKDKDIIIDRSHVVNQRDLVVNCALVEGILVLEELHCVRQILVKFDFLILSCLKNMYINNNTFVDQSTSHH